MKTCGWAANCENDDAGTAPTPPACVTGQFWTSDFSCCQEQHYGYDSPSGLRHSQLWSNSASIGTCDWTVSYVDLRNLDQGATGTIPGSTDITTNIAKLGTAWATCYLGPESESCGGPLCDRMVMSLQGTVYRATKAYSHWGASSTGATATGTNNLCLTINGPIDDANGPDGTDATPGRVGGAAPAAAPLPGARAPLPTPVRTASDASLQYNGGHYGNYDGHEGTKAVYSSGATIIMGIVNGMAGQHKEKWDEGVFEYVPFFGPVVATEVGGGTANSLDPSIPWVRDKTYKLTFYRGAKY